MPHSNASRFLKFDPESPIRTADFFAGIGGIRLGFDKAAKRSGRETRTVFANDIDPKCLETYENRFGAGSMTLGDISKIDADDIPDFDVMLGGFPCQAFSLAGHQLGFKDMRGTLIFELARILKRKRPRAFLLENVQALRNHDRGRTLATIIRVLDKEMDYEVKIASLNSRYFGVPQNRPRLYIVGFARQGNSTTENFELPEEGKQSKVIRDILEEQVEERVYVSQTYYEGMERHRKRHEAKGNGFGYKVLDHDGVANTLVCGGMGRERNLVRDKVVNPWKPGKDKLTHKNAKGLRRLTIREFARCQGFPDSYKFPVAQIHAYRQIANSVTVPVIDKIADRMLQFI